MNKRIYRFIQMHMIKDMSNMTIRFPKNLFTYDSSISSPIKQKQEVEEASERFSIAYDMACSQLSTTGDLHVRNELNGRSEDLVFYK